MNFHFIFERIVGLVLFVIVSNTGQIINKLKYNVKVGYEGVVEFTGSIDILQSNSFLHCSSFCLKNQKCMTFFYNIYTKECVLHSKDFIFTFPGVNGNGWKYFTTVDVSGRCPTPHMYYRHLDFCYSVGESSPMNFPNAKQNCINQFGKFALVDSDEKRDYFNHFLTGRPHRRICLPGDVQPDGSVVLEGKQLQYTNWYPEQPDNAAKECIRTDWDGWWYDCPCSSDKSCVYVCEFD